LIRELVDPKRNSESFIDLLKMGYLRRRVLESLENLLSQFYLKYLKVEVLVGLFPVGWYLDKLVSISFNSNMGKSDSLFWGIQI